MGITIFANNIVELFLEFLENHSIEDTVISVERWLDIQDRVTTLAGRFTSSFDTETAELIIDDFESALLDANVEIENDERDVEDAALIFGEDYYGLESSILYYASQCLF